jgi:hypothetical protein
MLGGVVAFRILEAGVAEGRSVDETLKICFDFVREAFLYAGQMVILLS